MTEKFLTIVADDFAAAKEIDAGILAGYQQGVITAASLLANGTNFVQAVQVSKANPGLSIGVHVNLTQGSPVSKNPASLIGPNGSFYAKWKFAGRCFARAFDPADLRREIDAQINRIKDQGIAIQFLNSHHHVHSIPFINRICRELAAKHDIPFIREIKPAAYRQWNSISAWQQVILSLFHQSKKIASFNGMEFSFASNKKKYLLNYLSRLFPGHHELMCHPAWCSTPSSRDLQQRNEELEALLHEDVRYALREHDIKLVTFSRLDAYESERNA